MGAKHRGARVDSPYDAAAALKRPAPTSYDLHESEPEADRTLDARGFIDCSVSNFEIMFCIRDAKRVSMPPPVMGPTLGA